MMLYFSRWKAAAILVTVMTVCLFVVPDFISRSSEQTWPQWAQRRLVLGLDLQGGSHLLLEVDANAVRKEMVEGLADEVRRVLRSSHSTYTNLVTRASSVELQLGGADAQTAMAKLRELSQPLPGVLGSTGQRSLDITDLGGGLVRLAPTPAALSQRVHQAVQQSVEIVERRVNELGTVEPTVESEGTDRILVEVPGLQDPTRLKELLGKTAKLTFQLVDLSEDPTQALQGQIPANSENSL